MKTYRVYAKLLGFVLPSVEAVVGGCHISQMSLEEQEKRGFHAYEGRLVIEDSLSSFSTFPRGIDSRVFKTNYVIYTDIKYNTGPNAAVGIANDEFELTIGSLTLAGTVWSQNKYGRLLPSVTYDYQICRIYEIVDGQEKPIEMQHPSSGVWMCDYPQSNGFQEIDQNILGFVTQTKHPLFLKALRYVMNSERGINFQYPAEKIFLDYFKSIEIIVQYVGLLKKNIPRAFRKRLLRTAKKLAIKEEDVRLIKKYYALRNNGDFAHATVDGRSIHFMPQFPRPSDSEIFNYDELRMLARKILLQFMQFIYKTYRVRINPPDKLPNTKFALMIGWRDGDYYTSNYIFQTNLRDKRKITPLAKKYLSQSLRINTQNLYLLEKKQGDLVFKYKDS